MNRAILFCLLVIFSPFIALAQDITGVWNGVLEVSGMQLKIVFHISKTGEVYTSLMDSPDQGVKGIPVASTTFANNVLKMDIPEAGITYTGEWKEKKFTGKFQQANMELPLDLVREEIMTKPPQRPQEPVKPYPYISEDVNFVNEKANITLAGTLTIPSQGNNFPVAILISGSGPQNRDEEILGHKPFLVISDYLTKNGIAVFRYDDRGTAKSGGDFAKATSKDFATDVESAIIFLQSRKEIDKNKIGLIGHSEGGIIAPIVAAGSKNVSFIIMLAGTGIPGDSILLMQQELIAKAAGIENDKIEKQRQSNREIFKIIHHSKDPENLRSNISAFVKKLLEEDPNAPRPAGMNDEDFVTLQVNQVTSPWMLYFITYDPSENLEKVSCPVLALNGEKDLQVPSKANLTAIKNSLLKGGNKNVITKEFPNLNHLFQESVTGSPDEYGKIEQTISPLVLEEMKNWILSTVNKKK